MEALERISTESARMVQIIRQLLLLSSAMEGDGNESRETISWGDFLQQFTDDRVSLRIEADKPRTIEANPYLLKMAMQNLVLNALKYSDGHVEYRNCRGAEIRIILLQVSLLFKY